MSVYKAAAIAARNGAGWRAGVDERKERARGTDHVGELDYIMRLTGKCLIKAVMLCCIFGLAVPVGAQGQSPTSPRLTPRPTGTTSPNAQDSLGGLDSGPSTSGRTGAAAGRTGATGTGTGLGTADQDTTGGTGAAGTGLGGAGGAAGTTPPAARAPRSGGAASAAGRTVTGGGEGGGEGAKLQLPPVPTLEIVGGEANFEPALEHPLEYAELPDDGEAMTLSGPIPLTEFLTEISLATGWNIFASEAAQGLQLQFFSIADVRPKDAMEILQFNGGIYYRFDAEKKNLYVTTRDEYLARQYGEVKPFEFRIQHANMEYIKTALTALKSSVGRLIIDNRTRRVYVWDTEDNIDHMMKMVEELDVELDMHEFRVHNTDFTDAEGLLNSLLSPNGSMLADARTGIIQVWDAPLALDRMVETLNRLDVPLDMQTFDIKFVSADDVANYLENAALISERGMVHVDPRTNNLIVTDRPERVSRMADMIARLDVELDTETWVLKYADLDFIAGQIEVLIPPEMGEIVINDRVRQITVTGRPDRLAEIDELVKTWDVQRAQVLIEVYFVDVSNDIERQFNINWSYFDMQGNSPIRWNGGGGFNTEDNSPFNIGQLPYKVPAYGGLELGEGNTISRPILTDINGEEIIDHFGGNNLAITLDYLEQQNKATVLNSPRVTVLDGEPAIFNNATRVPFTESTTSFRNTFGTSNTATNVDRIAFIDVGTLLNVTPRITDDQRVLLEISAEDSTFVDKEIVTQGQTSTVPQTTARRLETLVQVLTGETVVLGGLRRDNASQTTSRIPILGDLPGIGRIFRHPNNKSGNNTLLIFITPTVVDDSSSPETTFLGKAEENIATKHRYNQKSVWGRISELISDGRNEFTISVGQTGGMLAEGAPVTLDELREALGSLGTRSVKVVLRVHPRTPEPRVREIRAVIDEAGLKTELVSDSVPLVRSKEGEDIAAEGPPALDEMQQ